MGAGGDVAVKKSAPAKVHTSAAMPQSRHTGARRHRRVKVRHQLSMRALFTVRPWLPLVLRPTSARCG